jgi:hypothetical protein
VDGLVTLVVAELNPAVAALDVDVGLPLALPLLLLLLLLQAASARAADAPSAASTMVPRLLMDENASCH